MTRLAFFRPRPTLSQSALADDEALAEILALLIEHHIEVARSRIETKHRLRQAQEWLRREEQELRVRLRKELDTPDRRAWRVDLLRRGFGPKWIATYEVNRV